MKKFLLLTPLLLALAACGGNSENAATTVETAAPTTVAQTTAAPTTTTPPTTETVPDEPMDEAPPPLTANIIIRNTNDPLLPAFENEPTEIDFVALRLAAGSQAEYMWVDPSWGLVIISDEPMYNLQIITIDHNWEAYPLESFITGVLDEIDVLPAGTPLILSRFFLSGGVAPMEGIAFTDSTGVRRNMGIMDNRRDDVPPYFLVEFENVGQ